MNPVQQKCIGLVLSALNVNVSVFQIKRKFSFALNILTESGSDTC